MNFLAAQIFERDPFALSERMVWMTDNDQLVFIEDVDEQPGALRRVGHQPKIDLAIQHLRINLRRTPIFDVYFDLRMLLPECFEAGR
jgi:hypothetical protein